MGTESLKMRGLRCLLAFVVVFAPTTLAESSDAKDDLVAKLIAKVDELESMLSKVKAGDPSLEERISAVEGKVELNSGKVELNSEDITDIRMINGRQDIMIDENGVNIFSNLQQIDINTAGVGYNGAHIGTLDSQVSFIDDTRPPIGTIIPWMGPNWMGLPAGWQRGDGAAILTGPFKGNPTPDLNSAGLFLRGGSDSDIGSLQQATLQEHTHKDNGHKHVDNGHKHVDSGHSHKLDGGHGGSAGSGAYPAFIERNCDYTHTDKVVVKTDASHSYYCVDTVWDTLSTTAHIQPAAASIQKANSGMEGVEGASVGGETRPANMRVSYIVRIY